MNRRQQQRETDVPFTHAERGRLGGRAQRENLTSDQLSEIGRAGYLIGAVRTVVDRMADLTPEQRDELRAALRGESTVRHVDTDAMVAQYTAGASVRDVAAAAWVSYGTAYRRLRVAGVPMRSRNHRNRSKKPDAMVRDFPVGNEGN